MAKLSFTYDAVQTPSASMWLATLEWRPVECDTSIDPQKRINSHVASDVQAKKKKKSVGIVKFASESLLLHEAVLAETNSNLLLFTDVKEPYFFQLFGIHTG